MPILLLSHGIAAEHSSGSEAQTSAVDAKNAEAVADDKNRARVIMEDTGRDSWPGQRAPTCVVTNASKRRNRRLRGIIILCCRLADVLRPSFIVLEKSITKKTNLLKDPLGAKGNLQQSI